MKSSSEAISPTAAETGLAGFDRIIEEGEPTDGSGGPSVRTFWLKLAPAALF